MEKRVVYVVYIIWGEREDCGVIDARAASVSWEK